MPDPRVEQHLHRQFSDQQRIALALENDPKRIRAMKNVADLGVGFHWRKGIRTKRIGPVVFVTKKVPLARLAAKDRIPKTIKVGTKKLPVDVIEQGRPALLCSTGIADDQNKTYISIPPGVAMAGVAGGAVPPGRQGSSGAIIKIVETPQPPARYVLTCDHIVTSGQEWAQPWGTHPIMGSWVASATPPIDAALVETQFYLLDIHCLNVKQKEPVQPLVGMRVMKSGAGSGLTGSLIVAVTAADDVYINNDPNVPASNAMIPEVFAKHGDSGSVAWLGTPSDPRDATVNPLELGTPIEDAIKPLVNLQPPAQRAAKRISLLEEYRGRAVSLVAAVTAGAPPNPGAQPPRFCLGPAIAKVLQDFTTRQNKPVIIADD